MAKKKVTSRPNIPQDTLSRARRQAGLINGDAPLPAVEEPVVKTPAVAARVKQQAPRATTNIEDLLQEYAYVADDLRNMIILAAALFLMLIVLALVL